LTTLILTGHEFDLLLLLLATSMADGAKTKSSKDVDDVTLSSIIAKLRASATQSGPLGCWRSSLVPNGRGHVQIKHQGVKYLGHRIMACASKKPYKYVKYDAETKIEASHLCGNPACINPQHLFLENTLVNQTRDCCRMFRDLEGYKCPHKPACIGMIPVFEKK
jgi:hypothetical protein